MAHTGMLRTKFLVPSIGSIIQRRDPAPLDPNSSPSTASPGLASASSARTASSTPRSASLTGVRSGLVSTTRSVRRNAAVVMVSAKSHRRRASAKSCGSAAASAGGARRAHRDEGRRPGQSDNLVRGWFTRRVHSVGTQVRVLMRLGRRASHAAPVDGGGGLPAGVRPVPDGNPARIGGEVATDSPAGGSGPVTSRLCAQRSDLRVSQPAGAQQALA